MSVLMSNLFAVSDNVLLHRRATLRRRNIPVLRNSLTRYTARHLRIRRLIQFIFAGAVYCNAQEVWSALLCRPLRRVADMCSRKVSDTANMRIHERTQCVSAEEKILCRSPVSQRSHIGNLRRANKQGKGRSSKRKENRRLSFLFAPAAGRGTFPPSADGESPS